MQAVLNDSFLERETERQRQLQQEAKKAFEEKKAQLRKKELQLVEKPATGWLADAEDTSWNEPPRFLQKETPQHNAVARETRLGSAAETIAEPIDRVRSIPEIRSALIPLDESLEGKNWSKPFSLSKADLQPWLSFMEGYRTSRLFPEGVSTPHAHKPGENGQGVDVAIQALFELKRLDIKLILEPVVQIDGPAEYLDLAVELRTCRDPSLAKSLANIVNDVHENQMAKAFEKGRELGDHLYEALLGEGHGNLIKAWQKAYGRKPTVTELHLLLTTGRVRPVAKSTQAPEVKPQGEKKAAIKETVQEKQQEVVEKKPEPSHAHSEPAAVQTASDEIKEGLFMTLLKKIKPKSKREVLLHLLHFIACCAALAMYVL